MQRAGSAKVCGHRGKGKPRVHGESDPDLELFFTLTPEHACAVEPHVQQPLKFKSMAGLRTLPAREGKPVR